MTSPYFYIIQHLASGKYYAGVRYAQGCNPDELLKEDGYKTSSRTIHDIILDEGLSSFIIKKIKIFETGKEALKYETRFLRRVKARTNQKFLNVGENIMLPFNSEPFRQAMIDKFGVDHPSKSETIKEKIKQSNLTKLGVPYPMMSDEVRDRRAKNNIDKYGVVNVFSVKEHQERYKETMVEKYSVIVPRKSKEINDKANQTNAERYGGPSPMYDMNIRKKVIDTRLENHGTTNVWDIGDNRKVMQEKRANKRDRKIVQEILAMDKPKGYDKLGRGWYQRSDEALHKIYEELLSFSDN